MNVGEERRMKEVIVPADDLVCLGKDKLQELIRCRECKHWRKMEGSEFGSCWMYARYSKPLSYCDMAERKE